MNLAISPNYSIASVWEVLSLFLIPIGGGIPAGVLLARSRHIEWPMMMLLYFISDVILALLFEPIMLLVIWMGRRFQPLARFTEAMKKAMKAANARYGHGLSPFALIMVSFGVDPMTGRAAAVAAGHGFVMGWALAITGDTIFFTLLMASILWMSNVLGDGTWATIIIMVVTLVVPVLVRRLRERWQGRKQ